VKRTARDLGVWREDEWQRHAVAVERPWQAGSGRPVADRLPVQSRPGLIGRIPRAPGARDAKRADVAGDLQALQNRKSVKAGSCGNRGVGEAKVLEIAAVVSVAVRAVGANRTGIWKGAFLQRSAQP